ncbi:MAG: non-hydrolyzing UDP-N-acetylglucosamine 2-epimerase [Anaerolineae bacterium]
MKDPGAVLLTIVGARPQFIKAAAVSRAIREHNALRPEHQMHEILVHTGQHYDENMSQIFFDELDIPRPDYNLGVGSLPHGAQTGRMLEAIEEILLKEQPDWVLVYGDTNSTLAGALAAAKLHIPVAHVEAGLRSFNRRMPEELNRVLTDHVSSLLFCPTQSAVSNLAAEGITQGVELVGDVMYDCALFYADKVKGLEAGILHKHALVTKSYYLATVHRAENTDDPKKLGTIVDAFDELSTPECPVVIPLHPRTRTKMAQYDLCFGAQVRVLDPVSYLEMVALERNAKVILTDSGGVQKEAYFHGVPCVTLREETEWVETVNLGWNALCVLEASGDLRQAIRNLLAQGCWASNMAQARATASRQIVARLR